MADLLCLSVGCVAAAEDARQIWIPRTDRKDGYMNSCPTARGKSGRCPALTKQMIRFFHQFGVVAGIERFLHLWCAEAGNENSVCSATCSYYWKFEFFRVVGEEVDFTKTNVGGTQHRSS